MMNNTKEVSVAIAESSIGEEPQQQQKRKRGRPRKIVEKIEDIKAAAAEYEDVLEGESKKAETIEGEEEEKKEEQIEETQVSKQQPPRRSSRARRKSKPRKSS